MTGRTATVLIPTTVMNPLGGGNFAPGDEIAVFTPEGDCAGVAIWHGGALAIAAWEDDPFNPDVAGLHPGDPLHFRAYQASSGLEFGLDSSDVDVEYDPKYSDDGIFSADAIFVIQSLSFTPRPGTEEPNGLEFALEPAYPNPFRQSTHLAYVVPDDGEVRLELFDMLGRRVAVLVDEYQDAGRYEVAFSVRSEMAAGLFVARLQAGDAASTTRLTLVR